MEGVGPDGPTPFSSFCYVDFDGLMPLKEKTKFQNSNHKQIPIEKTNIQTKRQIGLDIVYWSLFGICRLRVGI
jgi:hypothetical protein